MGRTRLVGIQYSPWSARARMALDLSGVDYEYEEYTPQLGEPWLRWRLGRWSGPVTVPVLLHDEGALTDSFDIACWATDRGGRELVPAGQRDEVRRWNEVANRALEASRLRTTRRTLAAPEALRASLPPPVRALGPIGLAIGRYAANGLLTKYGKEGLDDAACERQLVEALQEIRAGLGGRETLLEGFTWADCTTATALTFVAPPAKPWLRLGAAALQVWREPAIAEQFADLVAWRDRVYGRWVPRI